MSVQKRRLVKDEERKYLRDLYGSYRSPVTRSRRLESNIDLQQLPANPPVKLDPNTFWGHVLGSLTLGSSTL